MKTKEITIRLGPEQIKLVRTLYPELSISLIARVLFDIFLENPYDEEVQDKLHEESVRTNTAIKTHQYSQKARTANERKESTTTTLRKQLLGSLRSDGDSRPN